MRGGSRGMARGMTPHTPSVPEDATGRPLTKRQIAALALLPAEPGRFLVNWRPILGRRGYLDLPTGRPVDSSARDRNAVSLSENRNAISDARERGGGNGPRTRSIASAQRSRAA